MTRRAGLVALALVAATVLGLWLLAPGPEWAPPPVGPTHAPGPVEVPAPRRASLAVGNWVWSPDCSEPSYFTRDVLVASDADGNVVWRLPWPPVSPVVPLPDPGERAMFDFKTCPGCGSASINGDVHGSRCPYILKVEPGTCVSCGRKWGEPNTVPICFQCWSEPPVSGELHVHPPPEGEECPDWCEGDAPHTTLDWTGTIEFTPVADTGIAFVGSYVVGLLRGKEVWRHPWPPRRVEVCAGCQAPLEVTDEQWTDGDDLYCSECYEGTR